jgi:hypothetical protein
MNVMIRPFTPAHAAVCELRKVMLGKILSPADPGYAGARKLWNAAVNRFPALFARCATVDDVNIAVEAARRHGVSLSVRGGGHDWAGRSLRQNGLVIDLSAMRQVEIDADQRVATVAGGATVSDVVTAATKHGLVAVTGNSGDIGMAGLTLGGGYGLLSPRFGLAADNLLSAVVVLADGRVVAANEQENPNLFWALRGGGGNSDGVTTMRIALHPLREVFGGVILFPWSDAAAVLRGYSEVMAQASEELSAIAGLLPTPDGQPVAFLAPMWCGDPAEGAHAIAALQRLGRPLRAQVASMRYTDLLARFDAHGVRGQHYAIQTRWLPALPPQVITQLVAAGGDRTSQQSMLVLHHLHGTATRVPPSATAFHLRRDHFLFQAVAAWEHGSPHACIRHGAWARALSDELVSASFPGGTPISSGRTIPNRSPRRMGRTRSACWKRNRSSIRTACSRRFRCLCNRTPAAYFGRNITMNEPPRGRAAQRSVLLRARSEQRARGL